LWNNLGSECQNRRRILQNQRGYDLSLSSEAHALQPLPDFVSSFPLLSQQSRPNLHFIYKAPRQHEQSERHTVQTAWYLWYLLDASLKPRLHRATYALWRTEP
jgi:hypothetical protein